MIQFHNLFADAISTLSVIWTLTQWSIDYNIVVRKGTAGSLHWPSALMAKLSALRKSWIFFPPNTTFLWISRSSPRPQKRHLFFGIRNDHAYHLAWYSRWVAWPGWEGSYKSRVQSITATNQRIWTTHAIAIYGWPMETKTFYL